MDSQAESVPVVQTANHAGEILCSVSRRLGDGGAPPARAINGLRGSGLGVARGPRIGPAGRYMKGQKSVSPLVGLMQPGMMARLHEKSPGVPSRLLGQQVKIVVVCPF